MVDGQLVLDEEIDENYEPTEQGKNDEGELHCALALPLLARHMRACAMLRDSLLQCDS